MSEKYRSLIDPIKAVGFIIGLGIACVNIAKNTFDPNLVHGTAETSVGALGGIFITYHNQIKSSFQHAAKSMLSFPQETRDSFPLFYAKEKSKELGRNLVGNLNNEKSFVLFGAPVRNDNKKKDVPDKFNVA